MSKIPKLEDLTIEQLKKLKGKIEKKGKIASQKITEKKSGIFDEFTNIDELLKITLDELRVLMQEQQETNRQLQINNKLLLALYYKEDSDGNVVPVSQPDFGKDILESIAEGGATITRVLNIGAEEITTDRIIFEGEFEGVLAEVLFVSSTSSTDNKDYSIKIEADDFTIYDDSWDNFESRSNHETDMACFEDEIDSLYLLQFQNVHFVKRIKVMIHNTSATFTRIYVKYHKKV